MTYSFKKSHPFILLFFVCTSVFGQRPFYQPQVHDIGIQLGSVNWIPELQEDFEGMPLAISPINAIRYKYHLTTDHAFRASAGYRRGNYELVVPNNELSTAEIKKRDLDFKLGYERTFHQHVWQYFVGIEGMMTRSNYNLQGLAPNGSTTIDDEFSYWNYGGSAFAGFRVFFSKNISWAWEFSAYLLSPQYDEGPENRFYLLPDKELGLEVSTYLSVHLGKMPKRCVCPKFK